MLLAIDIGNTDTVVGVFGNEHLINHFRVTSNHSLTIDECGFFITGLLDRLKLPAEQIDRIAMASVVPALTPVYARMSARYLLKEPLIVSSDIKLPIKIGYRDPAAVGADRIANGAAAFDKFRMAVIVVDFGTTTNFDVVDSGGVYLGGVIAPGPRTSARELARKAARLFEVPIEKPPSAIGRTTADSMKSGLFHGTVGMVDHLVGLIIEELGEKPRVVATGGLAADFEGNSRFIEFIIPELTLRGLKVISDFQSS